MSVGENDSDPAAVLREHANLYVSGAIETFAKDFQSLELETELRVSFDFIDDKWLAAACRTENSEAVENLIIEISTACLQAFARDIDVNSEAEAPIYEWRFCWLVFHEIAHWLYGHIRYYQQQGWIGEPGLCEAVSFSGNGLGSGNTDPHSTSKTHPLAHAAELQADAFATIELFNLINQLPVDEDDEDEQHPLELDIQFCYFCIVTTICSFYQDSGQAKGGPFHPSWNVRCLNILLTLFRAYSRARGLEGGPDLTYENHVVAAVVGGFIDNAVLPTVEGIEDFAKTAGLSHLVHDREQQGLYDPLDFIRLLNGDFDDQSLARELAEFLDLVDELNLATAPLRSARGFEPHSASVQPGKPRETFRFQILCNLPRAEIERVIDDWRDQHGLSELEIKFEPYAGPLDANDVIDIRFRVFEPITQRKAQDLVRQLIDASDNRAGGGRFEK